MTDPFAPDAAPPTERQLVEIPASHLNAPRIGNDRYVSDPGGVYGELRRTYGPVAPVLMQPGDVPAWLVLGYRELQQVTSDPETFARNTVRWRYYSQLPPDWPMWPMLGKGEAADQLLFTEGTQHQQRAGAVNDALRAVDPLEFRTKCEEFAEELIQSFAAAGTAELMSQYFAPLPVRAMGWTMGLPAQEGQTLAEGFLAAVGGGPDAAAGQQRARDIVVDVAMEERARATPRQNVMGRLAGHSAGLSDSQLVEDALVTVQAGHLTTANWGGNSLRLMLTDPRHTDTFARGRLSVSQALLEVLWDDTPTQVYLGRYTTRPVDLGRYRIPQGELVALGLAAGNADPHVRPATSGSMHGSRAYLSFSHGEHSCPVGAQDLAEIIATAAIEVLLDRLPDLRLACSPDELQWIPGVFMRGLSTLPVSFSPAPSITGVSSWI